MALTAVDEDSAKKLSISYIFSRAVHLLKALQAQPVTVSLDAASWANLRKCDMKRKEHVCRTIFKKISRNLVAHLRPAAYVLVLVGWAALDFVCCSNTRRTSTLCVPDLQNFGQFWNPRTLGGAFLWGWCTMYNTSIEYCPPWTGVGFTCIRQLFLSEISNHPTQQIFTNSQNALIYTYFGCCQLFWSQLDYSRREGDCVRINWS